MSITIEYAFNIDENIPSIIKNIVSDGSIIDSSKLDLEYESKNLPIHVLEEFSNILSNKFNELISNLVNDNLNQYKFSSLKQPLETICILKTGCIDLINIKLEERVEG